MKDQSRRGFLKTAGVTAAVSAIPFSSVVQSAFAEEAKTPQSTNRKAIPFDLGMASYTFRSFNLDQAIEMTKRLGLKKLTLKEMHLPLKSSDAEIAAAVEKIKQAGLELESCGVVYMKTEGDVAQAFAYAKKAGMKMIVAGPEPAMLPITERFAKETDIVVAIHNHGPTDKFWPAPEDAYKVIAKMDKRIGLCIDIAHTQRIGVDPTAQLTKCFDRVLDIHIKDCNEAKPSGTTVEIGRGVIDIPKFLREAVRLKYSRIMHFEFEKDAKDPLAGTAESVGYVHGVLAAI
jgi:sugar phosphate isomerase/epimerase